MAEDLINFDLPVDRSSIIKVVGVGGGGSNAVNHMYKRGIKDVNFVVCNTDAQALENSPVGVKVQLGSSLTEGRGAGSKPEIGRQAAVENLDDVIEGVSGNTKMVFITAGMGGGTGTGAAPVIARAVKEQGLLTVAIVTIPFRFEGQQRINQAIEGISEIEKYVDSLLIINNEKLREIYGNLRLSEAFSMADDVLAIAAKGIAEIITVHGYVNVDFADVETVMTNSGVAIMGSGMAEGEDRAIKAIQQALTSPLLNDNDITGAKNILLNITSGSSEVTMDEVGEVTDFVVSSTQKEANIIWGTGTDDTLGEKISVTIIATGFETHSIPELYARKKIFDKIPLNENRSPRNSLATVYDDKSNVGENVDLTFTQSTIEFELNDLEFNVKSSKGKSKKSSEDEGSLAEHLQKIKEKQAKLKEQAYHSGDSTNIEELENEPAYLRKKVELDQSESANKNVSRFTLADDEDNQVKLRDNNSYLHDNVD